MSRWTSADLAPVVSGARECLRADGGRLWQLDASPRWIVVDEDVWWLTEPEDGSTPTGRLWTYAADPHVAAANTGMDWHGRKWAMIDAGVDLPTVRLLLHEAFHAFWQPVAWDWVRPVDAGDGSLSQPGPRAAVITELHAWAAVLKTGDRDLAADAGAIRAWRLDQLSATERRRQDYLDLWEGICEYSAYRWTATEVAEIVRLARTRPRGDSWYQHHLRSAPGPALGSRHLLPDTVHSHRGSSARRRRRRRRHRQLAVGRIAGAGVVRRGGADHRRPGMAVGVDEAGRGPRSRSGADAPRLMIFPDRQRIRSPLSGSKR